MPICDFNFFCMTMKFHNDACTEREARKVSSSREEVDGWQEMTLKAIKEYERLYHAQGRTIVGHKMARMLENSDANVRRKAKINSRTHDESKKDLEIFDEHLSQKPAL